MNINRRVYFFLGMALLIWGLYGQAAATSTLDVAVIASAVALVGSFLLRRPKALYLIDIWLVGFVYLYSGEIVIERPSLLALFGETTLAIVEGFTVAAFGATLVGYALALPILRRRWCIPQHRWSYSVTSIERDLLPGRMMAVWWAMVALAAFFVLVVITLPQLVAVARSQRELAVNLAGLDSFMSSALVMLPVFTAYLWTRYQLPAWLRLVSPVVAVLALLVLFAIGTRYNLGIAVIGALFVLEGAFRHLRLQQFIRLGLLVVCFLAVQNAVLTTRSAPLAESEIDLRQIWQELTAEPQAVLRSEGILNLDAWVYLSRYYEAPTRVPEHLFLFYWWVPREVWPDKPTMAGYWVIRELTSERGFSAGHSASGGFGLSALLDFGPIWGALFCILYGLLLAGLESFVERHASRLNPVTMLAGVTYFGVFFMVRSFMTGLIVLMSLFFFNILPVMLLYRADERRANVFKEADAKSSRVNQLSRPSAHISQGN